MNVLVWFAFLLNNGLYMYVMFVAAGSSYRNSTNTIGWSNIMCPLESSINRFFDKFSYLNNIPQLNIIKMTNENESVYLKWPFFCMSHRQNGNFGIQVHTRTQHNMGSC